MDPNDWQRYKVGAAVRSGGMGLGIGGSSGSGNLGIADYLTENFDNLGGGSLTRSRNSPRRRRPSARAAR